MAAYTRQQGQYLAFIYCYAKINRQPAAEADMQRFFQTTAPAVRQMILKLEEQGFIRRSPGKPRSTEVLLPPDRLPEME